MCDIQETPIAQDTSICYKVINIAYHVHKLFTKNEFFKLILQTTSIYKKHLVISKVLCVHLIKYRYLNSFKHTKVDLQLKK